MATKCSHLDSIKKVHPSARGCEECLKTGQPVGASTHLPYLWARRLLRRLAEQARHQAFSFDAPSDHRGLRPPEGWGWCYVDEVFIDLGKNVTPQLGPIPRYV